MRNNNMLLISSQWNGKDTFKMIPISNDCPFNEVIYDPTVKALAIVGKSKKESMHMMDRLQETGEPKAPKKPRANGYPFEQQRIQLESYYEYYITKPEEVRDFVTRFAANGDVFNTEAILNPVAEMTVNAE